MKTVDGPRRHRSRRPVSSHELAARDDDDRARGHYSRWRGAGPGWGSRARSRRVRLGEADHPPVQLSAGSPAVAAGEVASVGLLGVRTGRCARARACPRRAASRRRPAVRPRATSCRGRRHRQLRPGEPPGRFSSGAWSRSALAGFEKSGTPGRRRCRRPPGRDDEQRDDPDGRERDDDDVGLDTRAGSAKRGRAPCPSGVSSSHATKRELYSST